MRVLYTLRGHPLLGEPPVPSHPGLATANLFNTIFRPTSAAEHYSDERPVYSGQSSEEELIPIDVLLGRYYPAERIIKIFIRNIEHYAHAVFRCSPSDLARVLRLHEYGHALVHLGLFELDDISRIDAYPAGKATDWAPFLTERDNLFSSLDEATHEYLAQLTTWLALSAPFEGPTFKPLRELFLALMQRQAPLYRIDRTVLNSVTVLSFPEALRWLWDPSRLAPPVGVPLIEAVTALSLPLPNGATYHARGAGARMNRWSFTEVPVPARRSGAMG